MKTKKMFITVICLLGLFCVSCSDKKDPLADESDYFKQQIELFNEYQSDSPAQAKEAMKKRIEATMSAPTEDISDFWKLQSLAFDQTRVAMIEEYLGNIEIAETYKKEALKNINAWLTQGNRDEIGYEKLLSSVVDADQEFKAKWHPEK